MSALLRRQSIVVMLLIALLFSASYYYIYSMPIGSLQEIRIISGSALLGLCLFGSLFLLSDSHSAHSHKIFALQMLMVALASIFTLMRIITKGDVVTTSADMLIYDNVYALVLLVYPFELLCPEQRKRWRYTRLILLAFLMTTIYSEYIRLGGFQTNEADNLQSLWIDFHKFDIWFRLIIFCYLILMLLVIVRQKRPQSEQGNTDTSKEDCIDLGKLNYYLLGYFLILTSYVVATLILGYHSFIIHNLAFLMLFGVAFYNTRLQRSPPLVEDVMEYVESVYIEKRLSLTTEDAIEDKYRFVDKIPQYKSDLERWMLEQQPYKNKGFKLLDVMQVLPLNRSYISHLFNEGYGETFFNFVMRYRIEESVRLLESNPEINIRRISDMCGFSSPSVFGRAFLKNKGITPKQYRMNLGL